MVYRPTTRATWSADADADKADVLRHYLRKWRWEVGQFFEGVGPDASETDLQRIAPNHPIFRVDYAPAE